LRNYVARSITEAEEKKKRKEFASTQMPIVVLDDRVVRANASMLIDGFEPPSTDEYTIQMDTGSLTSEIVVRVAKEHPDWPGIRLWKCLRRGSMPSSVIRPDDDCVFDRHSRGKTIYCEKTEGDDWELGDGVIR
jgi:hypothetical protein